MSKSVIARTVALAVVLINQILVLFNLNPLPFSEEEVYAGVTGILTAGVALWTWWKNNDVTDEAKAGTEYMQSLKEAKKYE